MDHYRDFFPSSQDVGDEDDFGPFTSQPAPCLSAPCRHMEHLDLNSQADGFPNVGSYQDYLQADDVGGDHGLAPHAPGRGHGGGRGSHQSRSMNTGAGSGGGRRGYSWRQKGEPWGIDGETFHGVTVDGSTSYIPSYASHDSEGVYGDENGEDADEEGFVGSPMSSDSRKRASSITDTATSPPKKSKSLMLKMFQGLITELQVARSKEEEALAEMAKQRQEEMEKKKKLREEEKQMEKDEKQKRGMRPYKT
ncbi:hypothetical protein ABZP36_008111 [Zizania latifolia]